MSEPHNPTEPRATDPPAADARPRIDLLEQALQLFEEQGERALEEFLAQHPQEAAELRAHIRVLQEAGFARDAEAAPVDRIPETLGQFRILRRLGGGGMGVVYLAEDPVLQRKVALKLIRPELLWFSNAQARFRREVQIIAQLQHSSIVRVFSAGEENGLPYYTMEWVAGISLERLLEEWKDRSPRELDDRQLHETLARLMQQEETDASVPLFEPTGASWVEVCFRWMRELAAALEHAHRQGVLHRDIKPSNVMLTWSGRVLLLDFGLASTRESTRITRSGTQLGSLPYMPPEQMRADADAIDERSDVYSLGVTLYELLSLKNPFWSAGQSDERVRARVLAGAVPPLRTLNPGVSLDAETVCAKAMDLEAARRYATAAALARDLRNVLELRPIEARPLTRGQRLRRYARRHPSAVVAASLGFLLVVVAPTGIAVRERIVGRAIAKALTKAQTESEIRNELMSFLLEDLLAAVSPVRVGKDASMRQVLDLAAGRIAGRFEGRPLVEASIRVTLGSTYRELGVYDVAEQHLTRARDLLEEHAGKEAPETLTASCKLAQVYGAQDRFGDAEELGRRTLEAQRRILGREHPDTMTTQNNLGLTLYETQQYPEAEELLLEVLEVRRRDLGAEDRMTLTTMNNLGILYRLWGHLADAALWTREEYEMCRKVLGDEHPDAITSLNNWACVVHDDKECARLLRRAIELTIKAFGEAHPKVVLARLNYGLALVNTGELDEAEQVLGAALELEDVVGSSNSLILKARTGLGRILTLRRRYTEALDLLAPTLQTCIDELGETDPTTANAWIFYGMAYVEMGELEQAVQIIDELIEAFGGKIESLLLVETHFHLASCCRRLKRFEDAEEALAKAFDWLDRNLPEHPLHGQAMREFVQLYREWGKPLEAEPWRQRLRAAQAQKSTEAASPSPADSSTVTEEPQPEPESDG